MPNAPDWSPGQVRRTFDALAGVREGLAGRDERVLDLQVRVSQIPAPTGRESARAAWMGRRFSRMGYEVSTDDAGNVVARTAGRGVEASVWVLAHLDTVFPVDTDLTVRVDGHRLLGPGIGDNGRGLATMLVIAGALARGRVRTRLPVVFAATTGEEGLGDLRGAKRLFAHSAGASVAAIVIDGAGDDRIVHRALGSRRFRVTFTGVGGHSWAAFGTANPLHAAAIAAASLARVALPMDPRTTMSVGRMGGGISVNAIPESGWLEVDVRSSAPAVLDRVERDIGAACLAAAEEENARRAHGTVPLAHTIQLIGDRPCGEVPADDPLVRMAVESTALVGREAELSMASTDANVPISLGIPAVAIGGGGRGGDAHTRDEWYDNRGGSLGVARALTLVCAAAGLSS